MPGQKLKLARQVVVPQNYFPAPHLSLPTPETDKIRAVLLPMGAVKSDDRVKAKHMLIAYDTIKTRRRYGYTELVVSEQAIAKAIKSKGGAVTEIMAWEEHPQSERRLSKALKVMACADYKGAGRTRYLLLATQRSMTPKELRETYGEANVEEHWNPRTYDAGPAEVSLAVAWLKERYQK